MSRPLFIALAGFVVIAVAVAMSYWTQHREELPGQTAPVATVRPAPNAPAESDATPSFDVVRINPQGETGIAGRAQPRAEVQILDGGKEIGRVIADNRGEWVFVPDQPLPAGSRELSLKATNPDGTTSETKAPVVLVVPDREKEKGASLAVKINPDGSIDILQGPTAKEGAGTVAVAGIRYDDQNHLSITGKASPKAQVQVYLDNQPLGSVRADDQGNWRISPKIQLKAGNHTVRADELGADGKVTARAETTFSPMSTAGVAPSANGKIVVEVGNSLWRIARRSYGAGYEYLTIFQANKDQIRNPDKIYPGQVFTIPVQQRPGG